MMKQDTDKHEKASPGGAEAARYLGRLLIFLTPVFLVFGPALTLLWRSGELVGVHVEKVVEIQLASREREVLYGLAYSECDVAYKFASLQRQDYDVLVLGTSRVLQLRPVFFKQPERVYNAGRIGRRLRHFGQVLEGLDDDQWPTVLVLGLDQYFFSDEWDQGQEDGFAGELRSCGDTLSALQRGWRMLYGDIASGKIPVSEVLFPPTDRIGVTAIVRDGGFRLNGSYRYDEHRISRLDDPDHERFGFRDTLDRIEGGHSRFEYTDKVSERGLEELDRIVTLAREHGAMVVAFTPPFPPLINDRMEQTGQYGYLHALARALSRRLDGPGLFFRDFTDVRDLGATDAEFVDGLHGSERTYARVLLALSEEVAVLRARTDQARLRRLIGADGHPMLVLDR